MSNNTSDECIGGLLPAYEAPGLLPTLIALHLVTFVIFLIHIQAFFDRIEFSHPVFAVILQDLIILTFCEIVNLLLLSYVAWTHSEPVFVLSMLVSRLAMQFHPVSWLVVTFQRYYLLVLKPNSDFNLDSLRRRSLTSVWIIFLPFLVLTHGTVALILNIYGWPQIPLRNLGQSSAFLISLSAIIISNLPDLVSVTIYFALWKHFKESPPFEDDSPYGGIWVGEVMVEPPPGPAVLQNKNDSEHKAGAVLKALGWHLKLCLVDLAFPILGLLGCNTIGIYFVYPMQILCFYWIPFLVIKNGFKQLDGVIKHFVRMKIFKIPSNNVVPNAEA